MERRIDTICNLVQKQTKETDFNKKKDLYDKCKKKIEETKKELNDWKDLLNQPDSDKHLNLKDIFNELQKFDNDLDVKDQLIKYVDCSHSLNKIKKELYTD
jgi:predicted translin family RNA/ssDNA-binding protein